MEPAHVKPLSFNSLITTCVQVISLLSPVLSAAVPLDGVSGILEGMGQLPYAYTECELP